MQNEHRGSFVIDSIPPMCNYSDAMGGLLWHAKYRSTPDVWWNSGWIDEINRYFTWRLKPNIPRRLPNRRARTFAPNCYQKFVELTSSNLNVCTRQIIADAFLFTNRETFFLRRIAVPCRPSLNRFGDILAEFWVRSHVNSNLRSAWIIPFL